MSAYTKVCSEVLFPLHEWLKRHDSTALRAELERTQWCDTTALREQQTKRLRDFLTTVALTVPYYQKLFASIGFVPEKVASLNDLEAIPFLTKAAIRANLEELKSVAAAGLVRYSTGGSSGEPLVFYMGMDRVSHDVAAKWRATRWWGVDIGDPEVVLWGSPIELGRQDWFKGLRDRLLRTHLLPAFNMSEQRMTEFLQTLRKLRPRMMFGYASALALLAGHAVTTNASLDALGVRVVFVTGETLYPQQRELIERVFKAPVANGYGSRDAGFIAHECPSGSLHLSAEHILVELVGETGERVASGETGEIVVTHLATREFPFIRYRTGDLAVQSVSSCPCGRGLPVLETVHGRTTDFIRTRSGNAMHALALIYEVRDEQAIQAFKFVQAQDLSIELQLVAGPELTAHREQQILVKLARRLGPDTPITIARVARIQPEKSGKYRYVVSQAV
jgi:phenylacetate-coenzyme A ligase PaaK-like adenylate-forming protein